ncbi:putative bifunctional diguanylate cyclase/phosphodiesterase [Tropicimonas sediminicola]|uniref:Diguanylate cyclase (GGDEF) domain-containing protein n=1 Tax=Tropicimonas sediminicola TaxID=1031541 RepID=A0A239DCI5_9RHOB|nr:EAL domain-containing protein [Tropicimonas sediminicola]SNS30116.1 diguanylate cyclase (GGDEF) domain-containing protein [Tropicimonas sediminicola]
MPSKLEYLLLVALFPASWILGAQFDLFEGLVDYIRLHEEMELDELISAVLVLGLLLPALLGIWNRRLRRHLRSRQLAEQRAQHISRHDALTGLYNRRVMNDALRERIAKARRGGAAPAILLMDLDRFKPVNDLRGHDVGDLILREVARRVKACCGEDELPIRLGGDEFAILAAGTEELGGAGGLPRRILAAMERKFIIGDSELSIGASLGVAIWREGLDAPLLLRHADQAMYRAKKEGRGRISYFDDALGERLRELAELEAELTAAIEREEIEPYFQPIVQIADRKLVGFEVLARWHHDRLGNVPPDRFIQLAEETGQIAAISWQILRKACIAARDWDPSLTIAFNLSAKQFRDADLSPRIEAILRETGFPAERLEIEITETAIIDDIDRAHEVIDQLRWQGIQISLDDFGTGFSSLATLSRLPFDRLKIDSSFVTTVSQDRQKAKIVAGIISLAGSLDLSVTAEGIETEDTLEMLAGLQCPLGQGYLFDRPMPRDKVDDLLSHGVTWTGEMTHGTQRTVLSGIA